MRNEGSPVLKAKYSWHLETEGIVPDDEIYRVILANRKITDPERFFSMGEESLHDPYLILGMEKAVNRVIKALSANEKILIYGDYDCDGISAITVMVRTLMKLGANVSYDLPDRFQDGYGLNMNAVNRIIDDKIDLVITVDNGITAIEEVAKLKAHGIDTIVTDHHEEKAILPDAYQILHAKLSPGYPFKEIAGVMVAYKFASAFANDPLRDMYDLVMIGTIADLMPLEDENQAMVNLGLKQLKKTKIPGLRKLVEFSHLDIINETAIAFKIAPKINSSGRLGKALQAVRLLVSDDESEVNELIYQIEENHASRKDLTESGIELSESLVDPNDEVIVVSSHNLHEGIIGICAQKLAEKYQKTAIVITLDNEGMGKGSARSFGDQNILELLEKNRDLLLRFGGHQQAAGLQIRETDIPIFRENLNRMSERQEEPLLKIDMEVNLDDVRTTTIKKLQDLSFFTATFLFSKLRIVYKQLINNKHVKLTVAGKKINYDILAFNNTDYYHSLEIGDRIDVVGSMNLNTWRSKTSLQVIVKDLKADGVQAIDLRSSKNAEEDLMKIRQREYLIYDDTYFLVNDRLERSATYVIMPRKLAISLSELLAKDMLAKLYRILERNQHLTLAEFATFGKIDIAEAEIVATIFTELGFATRETDGITFVDMKQRRELTESTTYVAKQRLARHDQRIYREKNPQLTEFIKTIMEE